MLRQTKDQRWLSQESTLTCIKINFGMNELTERLLAYPGSSPIQSIYPRLLMSMPSSGYRVSTNRVALLPGGIPLKAFGTAIRIKL